MESVRPRIARRRPRRGSTERPINVRLVRTASLLLALPILLVGFTVARPGPLPVSTLPPSFDGGAATRLTRDLARDYPSRVPGSAGALGAAGWYREQLALYGLRTQVDRWRERVPTVGTVALENLITVVPGRTRNVIAIVAHRDNDGLTSGANDNASGTAALVELVRGYGTAGGIAQRVQPLHTLVFVSTDGGAHGSLGARRFAEAWGRKDDISAVLVLDGIAGRAPPRLEIAGEAGRSPSPAFVRTVTARFDAVVSAGIARPGFVEQLVGLGLRYAYGEQGAFLAAGRSAVRVGNSPDGLAAPGTDEPGGVQRSSVTRLGRAAEATLASLNQTIALPSSTRAYVFAGDSAVRGWSIAFVLLVLLVPFGVALVDLQARLRRRGVALAPAFRALGHRLGFWFFAGLCALVAAYAGVFERDAAGPLPPAAVGEWPVAGLIAVGAAVLLAWLVVRVRLLPSRAPAPEEELAGQVAALAAVGASALLTAIANPYGLVFVAPSLAAWLWLPQLRTAPRWVRDAVFGVGLAAPVVAVVTLTVDLDLGARSLLYVAALFTTGVVPWLQTLALLVWAAAAGQLAAVEAGRYAPAARTPAGPVPRG